MKIKITQPDGTVVELEAAPGSKVEIGEQQAAPMPMFPITVPPVIVPITIPQTPPWWDQWPYRTVTCEPIWLIDPLGTQVTS